jgi:hypothetical protein
METAMARAPLILCFVLVIASAGSALALDEPYVWRDDQSGCAYLLTQAGGITPRLRHDGTPDCPDAREPGTALVDNAVRGLRRGLDDLRRELDNRFGDQTNPPPR